MAYRSFMNHEPYDVDDEKVQIIWDKQNPDTGYGKRKNFGISGPFYKPIYGLKLGIEAIIINFIQKMQFDFYTDEKGTKIRSCRFYFISGSVLNSIYPEIKWIQERRNVVLDLVEKYMAEYIQPTGNFSFESQEEMDIVIKKSLRNSVWKSECFICLSPPDPNFTGLSHYIFCPCGHHVCSQKCYTQLRKSKGYPEELDPVYIKNLGYVHGMNVRTNDVFICPYCNQETKGTFIAEDAKLSSKFPIDDLVNEVWNHDLLKEYHGNKN